MDRATVQARKGMEITPAADNLLRRSVGIGDNHIGTPGPLIHFISRSCGCYRRSHASFYTSEKLA
jgi:hypothetical protein